MKYYILKHKNGYTSLYIASRGILFYCGDVNDADKIPIKKTIIFRPSEYYTIENLKSACEQMYWNIKEIKIGFNDYIND